MPVDLTRCGAGKRYPARAVRKLAIEIVRLLDHERHELSVALVGDREIRRLNAKYRNKDYATDVLSFPVIEAGPESTLLLGDVVISVDRAVAQAKERGRKPIEELTMLLIHGIVHLLGYDHERSAREARVMRRLERKVYQALCDRGIL
jgi:probable rRNA maturation factor